MQLNCPLSTIWNTSATLNLQKRDTLEGNKIKDFRNHSSFCGLYRVIVSFFILTSIFSLSSCEDNETPGILVDLDTFEIAGIAEFPYHPDGEYDYFAIYNTLRVADGPPLYSSGSPCSSSSDPLRCQSALDSLNRLNLGAPIKCLPNTNSYFVLVQSADEVYSLNTKEAIKTFIGDIDEKGDAILWATLNCYRINEDNKSNAAIKSVEGGYELLGVSLVSMCQPIQTNRFHLRIDTNGTVSIIAQEVLNSSSGCI